MIREWCEGCDDWVEFTRADLTAHETADKTGWYGAIFVKIIPFNTAPGKYMRVTYGPYCRTCRRIDQVLFHPDVPVKETSNG